MNPKSPIREGNEWRFSASKQPKRQPTMKQQSKLIEALLSMPMRKVEEIAEDNDAQAFIKMAANKIVRGEIKEVVSLIAEYKKTNRKEVV